MTARHTQYAIASVFLILGGWALLAPHMVIEMTMQPAYREGAALPFAVGCFGAQACICAVVIASTRFTAMSFVIFGIILLPFFAFDYWFTRIDPVLNSLGLLDLVGNIIMLGLCFYGYRQAKREAIAA